MVAIGHGKWNKIIYLNLLSRILSSFESKYCRTIANVYTEADRVVRTKLSYHLATLFYGEEGSGVHDALSVKSLSPVNSTSSEPDRHDYNIYHQRAESYGSRPDMITTTIFYSKMPSIGHQQAMYADQWSIWCIVQEHNREFTSN